MKTVELNGRVYECPYADLFRALTDIERSTLKRAITEDGIRAAIWLDADGRVIDGVNRLEIAVELGLDEVPETRFAVREDEARDKAELANVGRRNLTPEELAQRWGKLHKNGQSLRQIAQAEGVSKDTVARAISVVQLSHSETVGQTSTDSTPGKIVCSDGKQRPAVRATEAAMEARQEKARALKSEGEPLRKIAQQLGVSAQTVANDLAAPEPVKPTATATHAKPEYITLDSYLTMSESDRASALALTPSAKTFNKQDTTSIEWAQFSWNPVTGCRHDCPYCYARDIAGRFYEQGFEPSIYPERLAAPVNTSVPKKAAENTAHKNVFACSMADLWGRWVPAEWIQAVLDVVRANPQWNFLFLTKFPKRMSEFDIPENAWVGTSVDCQVRVKNAEQAFARVNARVKWLSIEPMLEPLKFERLDLFQWVVIGGASASNNTPEWVPPLDWIVDLHAQARAAGCRLYYKTNCGMHDSLRLREFPWEDPTPKNLPDVFRYLGQAKSPNQSPEGAA